MSAMISFIAINFIFMILGILMLCKLPGINMVFGYRTPKSMVNEETWKCANNKAGKDILVVSVINMFIMALVLILVPPKDFENVALGFVLGSSAIIIFEFVFIIISTERLLNKKFKDVYSGKSQDSKNGKGED